MLSLFGAILMIAAGLLAYTWRKYSAGRLRMIGGLLVIGLPVLVFCGIATWSALADKSHVFHALPPEDGVSTFEALLVLTIGIAPFWSFGALCGYLLRSRVGRPPQR